MRKVTLYEIITLWIDPKKEWYRVKDKIKADIEELAESQQLIDFSSEYKPKTSFVKTNPYTAESLGKTCVSLDLREANYNALKLVSPNLVFNTADFSDLVSRYSSIPLFSSSKIFRQLTFEPLCAKKQGLIQKELILKLMDHVSSMNPSLCRVVGNDELVLTFDRIDLAKIQESITS